MPFARILNGKTIPYPKNRKNPLNLPFLLGTDEIELPDGWKQTCMACPMQYEKIIKKGGLHFVGYLRSRHDYPFSIEIFVTLNPKDWAVNSVLVGSIKPVDMFDDNPPLESMALIDEIFKALVRLK